MYQMIQKQNKKKEPKTQKRSGSPTANIIQKLDFVDPGNPHLPNPLNSTILAPQVIGPGSSVISFNCDSHGKHAMIFAEHIIAGIPYNLKIDLEAHGNGDKSVSGTTKSGVAQINIGSFGTNAASQMLNANATELDPTIYALDPTRIHGTKNYPVSPASVNAVITEAQRLKALADAGNINYDYFAIKIQDTNMNCASFVQNVANAAANAPTVPAADSAILGGISGGMLFKTPKNIAGM